MSNASKIRTTTSSRAPRRRDEAKALFRNAILDAAEQIFAERGFHGSRIQDIAEKARIGVGTVYNHFAQKEDVLHALIDERTEAMLEQLLPASAGGPEPADFTARLTARVARMLRYVESHRGLFTIVMEAGLEAGPANSATREITGRSMKHIERFRAAFRALVEDGIASGDLAPRDPAHLSVFLGGAIKAFTYRGLLEEADLAGKADLIVGLFLHGAVARKPGRGISESHSTPPGSRAERGGKK